MVAVKRISVFIGAIMLAGVIASLSRGPAGWQMSEPLTLALVLGFTALLGVLTYDPKQLGRELLRVFTSAEGTKPFDRRITGQLALYALAAGLVLSIVQILIQQFAAGEAVDETFCAAALRMPLMSLLYGVLTGVGLWAVSGHDLPDAVTKRARLGVSERRQLLAAFCVLMLTAGVLSTFILSMNLMARGELERKAGIAEVPAVAVRPLPDKRLTLAEEAGGGPRMHLDLERAQRTGETSVSMVAPAGRAAIEREVPAIKAETWRIGKGFGEASSTPAVATRRVATGPKPEKVVLRWEQSGEPTGPAGQQRQ